MLTRKHYPRESWFAPITDTLHNLGSAQKKLFTDDADFNTEYEGEVSPGLSKFSKKKRIRKIQNLTLKKTYKEDISKIKSSIAKTIETKRIASNIEVSTPLEDFETLDFGGQDTNFDILSQQIKQDEQPAKVGWMKLF